MAVTGYNEDFPPFPAQYSNVTISSTGRNILTQADIDELGHSVNPRDTLVFVSLGGVEQATIKSLLDSVAGKAKAFRTRFSPGVIKERVRVIETNSIHTRIPSAACQVNYNSVGKIIYDHFRLDQDGLIYSRQSLDTSSKVILCSLLSQSTHINDTIDVTMGTLENMPDPQNKREFCKYLRTLVWQIDFKIDSIKKLENHRWKSLFIKKGCATWVPSHLEATVEYLEINSYDSLVSIETRIRAAQQLLNSNIEAGNTFNWSSHDKTGDGESNPWIPVKAHTSRDQRSRPPKPEAKPKKFVQKEPGSVGERYPPPGKEDGLLKNRFENLDLETNGDSELPSQPPMYSSTPAAPTQKNAERQKVSEQSNLNLLPEEPEPKKDEGRPDPPDNLAERSEDDWTSPVGPAKVVNIEQGRGPDRRTYQDVRRQSPRYQSQGRGGFRYRELDLSTPRRRLRQEFKRHLPNDEDIIGPGSPRKQSSPGRETLPPETKPSVAKKEKEKEEPKGHSKSEPIPKVGSVYPQNLLEGVDEYQAHKDDIEDIESDEEAFQTAILSSTLATAEPKQESRAGTPLNDERSLEDNFEDEEMEDATPKVEEAHTRIKHLEQGPISASLPLNISSVDRGVAEHMILLAGRPLLDTSKSVTPFLENESISRERESEKESKRREKIKQLANLKKHSIRALDLEMERIASVRESHIRQLPAEERLEFTQSAKVKARTNEMLEKRVLDKEINQAYRMIKVNKKKKNKIQGKREMMETLHHAMDLVNNLTDEEREEGSEHDYEDIELLPPTKTEKDSMVLPATAPEKKDSENQASTSETSPFAETAIAILTETVDGAIGGVTKQSKEGVWDTFLKDPRGPR